MENLEFRCATAYDVLALSTVLTEAASWLKESGIPLWDVESLSVSKLKPQVSQGDFWLCYRKGELVGVLKFQLEDRQYWPESVDNEAAYVHKLVVRKSFSGEGLSSMMLEWAANRAGELGRPYLRLDCEASRGQLRRIYEKFGFRRVGDIDLSGRIMARFQLEIGR